MSFFISLSKVEYVVSMHWLVGEYFKNKMSSNDTVLLYRFLVNNMLPKLEQLVTKLNKLFFKFTHEVLHEEDERRYIRVKDIVDLEMNPVLSQLLRTEKDYEMKTDALF